MDTWLAAALMGVLATLATDVWQLLLARSSGMPPANWRLVGRWVIGMGQGHFHQPQLALTPAAPGELPVGWAFHHLIGIAYSLAYVGVLRIGTLAHGLDTALWFGVATLIAPLLLMKPAMGAGWFGWKAPRPLRGLLLSVATHLVFGLGLFGAGMLLLRQ